MSQKVTVRNAAKEIGCDPEYLRRKMKTGEWDLGEYEKGKKRARYFVFRKKLDKFLGIMEEQCQ